MHFGVFVAVGKTRPTLALLDTGAVYSILGPDILDDPTLTLGQPMSSIRISSRFGPIAAELRRVEITLVADRGHDLPVEATVATSRDWPGPPIVLGAVGLLDRIRFALDPGGKPDAARWWFGPPA